MKLLAATAITLSLFASAFAQTNQTGAASDPAVAQAPGTLHRAHWWPRAFVNT